jgi:hypothetical protein
MAAKAVTHHYSRMNSNLLSFSFLFLVITACAIHQAPRSCRKQR